MPTYSPLYQELTKNGRFDADNLAQKIMGGLSDDDIQSVFQEYQNDSNELYEYTSRYGSSLHNRRIGLEILMDMFSSMKAINAVSSDKDEITQRRQIFSDYAKKIISMYRKEAQDEDKINAMFKENSTFYQSLFFSALTEADHNLGQLAKGSLELKPAFEDFKKLMTHVRNEIPKGSGTQIVQRNKELIDIVVKVNQSILDIEDSEKCIKNAQELASMADSLNRKAERSLVMSKLMNCLFHISWVIGLAAIIAACIMLPHFLIPTVLVIGLLIWGMSITGVGQASDASNRQYEFLKKNPDLAQNISFFKDKVLNVVETKELSPEFQSKKNDA